MSARLVGLLCGVLACVGGSGFAFAATLGVSSDGLSSWSDPAGCTPSTVTVGATADAYGDQDVASTNFGTGTTLRVRAPLLSALGVDLGGRARTLVRFALPEPELCSVLSATLRLNATSASAGRTLEAVRLAATWAEGTVTWNTQPATTGAAVTSSSGTGWREWTVTAQVQAMYGATNAGFIVRDTAGSLLAPEQVFSSRTAATNRPELVISLG